MTLGSYVGWTLIESIWQGYHEDGVLGALNSVNPLYGIAIGAINVYDAIERGDYRAAGHSGATTTIMVVTTVATVAAGAGALAKSAGPGGLKKVPNTHGKLGGPAHKAKIAQVESDIKARGLTPMKEHRVIPPKGEKSYRDIDVVARDRNDQIVEYHQIGRQTKGGQPVAREVRALDDIERATGKRPQFHPYN